MKSTAILEHTTDTRISQLNHVVKLWNQDLGPGMERLQRFGKRLSLVLLPMSQNDPLQGACTAGHQPEQFVLVGMRAEGIHHFNMGFDLVLFPKNTHLGLVISQESAQSERGAETRH